MSTLTANGLIKHYRKRQVVKGVDLEVNSGEVVGLLGPNGAGKTTTFYMVVGMIPADGGRVTLDGNDITELPMYQRARKGVGYLPQDSSVFRKLTVSENIMAILETLDISESERRERLEILLGELDIARLAKQKAYTLSGGERRRLEITRSLVTNPAFILFDEPFTGIDPKAVMDIQNIIFKLKDKGIGILITDHRVREMLEITDRSYIIYNGEIIISGTPQELVENQKAKEVYLGEKFRI